MQPPISYRYSTHYLTLHTLTSSPAPRRETSGSAMTQQVMTSQNSFGSFLRAHWNDTSLLVPREHPIYSILTGRTVLQPNRYSSIFNGAYLSCVTPLSCHFETRVGVVAVVTRLHYTTLYCADKLARYHTRCTRNDERCGVEYFDNMLDDTKESKKTCSNTRLIHDSCLLYDIAREKKEKSGTSSIYPSKSYLYISYFR